MEDEKIISGGRIKPTFVSGGAQGDRIRNITGGGGAPTANGYDMPQTGAYSDIYTTFYCQATTYAASLRRFGDFSSHRVVPIGSDDAPSNLSKRLWRRVA